MEVTLVVQVNLDLSAWSRFYGLDEAAALALARQVLLNRLTREATRAVEELSGIDRIVVAFDVDSPVAHPAPNG